MIDIVCLPPDQWKIYKDLRVRMVTECPPAYSRTPEEEQAQDASVWQERLAIAQQPDGNILLFARDDENVVGMLAALVGDSERTKHSARVVSVYVVPEYRGKGVMTVLFEELFRRMRARDMLRVTLEVTTTQTGAHELYKKLGFKTIGITHKAVQVGGVFYDHYLMEKFLNE